jgi:hypothetical protein
MEDAGAVDDTVSQAAAAATAVGLFQLATDAAEGCAFEVKMDAKETVMRTALSGRLFYQQDEATVMASIEPLFERLPAEPNPGQGSAKENRQARKRLLLAVAIFFSHGLFCFLVFFVFVFVCCFFFLLFTCFNHLCRQLPVVSLLIRLWFVTMRKTGTGPRSRPLFLSKRQRFLPTQ